MFVPLHAGHGGVDPFAIVVGAFAGLAIWQAIRLLAESDTRKGGGA
ncbi:hypothetical protein [Halorussus salinus]|nr:hypothetical protein [Halorussus salinus]